MRRSGANVATLVLALALLSACGGNRATPSASDDSGYVLPRSNPDRCAAATGSFNASTRPRGFAALVTRAKKVDPAILRAVRVVATPADKDREVSASEEKILTRARVGDRTIRMAPGLKGGIVLDWFEHGWGVGISSTADNAGLADDIAAHLELPKTASPNKIKLHLPSDARVIAQTTATDRAGGYVVSVGGCEADGLKGTYRAVIIVSFFDAVPDERLFVGDPAGAGKYILNGRAYWRTQRGQVTWREGPAIINLVTSGNIEDPLRYADALRRVEQPDVASWIEQASKKAS